MVRQQKKTAGGYKPYSKLEIIAAFLFFQRLATIKNINKELRKWKIIPEKLAIVNKSFSNPNEQGIDNRAG